MVSKNISKIFCLCIIFRTERFKVFMQKKLVENVIYLTDLIAQKIYCFWSILGSRKLEMNAMYLRSEFVRNILNILIHFPSFFGPERWKHVSIHFRNIFGQVKYGLPAVMADLAAGSALSAPSENCIYGNRVKRSKFDLDWYHTIFRKDQIWKVALSLTIL